MGQRQRVLPPGAKHPSLVLTPLGYTSSNLVLRQVLPSLPDEYLVFNLALCNDLFGYRDCENRWSVE